MGLHPGHLPLTEREVANRLRVHTGLVDVAPIGEPELVPPEVRRRYERHTGRPSATRVPLKRTQRSVHDARDRSANR